MQVVPLAPQGLNTSSQFESGTGVRWLGSGELKIEMAGAWAGTEGKWRFIAINRWLEWLDASYLDTWPWGSPPLVLDMDLSRNDLTDEEFKWILLHLDRGPANVQRLRASFNQLTEKCVDALVGMLDIGNEQRVAELHLNGNSLGNRGVSAVLTAVATSSRHQHGSAVAHELPPLWLRVDDNSTDCEAELVSSIFQPGEYCMATLPASCTPDICGNGALVHLFNFGRQELPTGS
ncbi:hypothetical protein Pmar_PMAR020433 [Perkinsus marinus ATCC 50983]|uniref:Uncharacterized protein n=1 Tax=Perkinsus marinus (strain ATCC 50983 / TXsc) TaxID=423536 RepID=C5L712_PERM5|nr:hypothetical protein Pmar_PMAR020433 [Perkinsus marinus ATCC 50983]EER07274.1 hypothetical protein Pmar_PMAR020433 [Perkinsus marinus ATCC 50983]|eukprot:XP_002775458.1 hypothetical protein Pmar_PMAR020433 [Perkinsus marinus ATCC 50983]